MENKILNPIFYFALVLVAGLTLVLMGLDGTETRELNQQHRDTYEARMHELRNQM